MIRRQALLMENPMIRRRFPVLAIAIALFVTMPAWSSTSEVQAQDAQGRFFVLIPNFFPVEGTDDDFGKDVAKELRELLNQLATHRAYDEGEIKDELRRFDIKIEDLDCLDTRQVATAINQQVALCASYREVGRNEYELFDIEFWDMTTSQSFRVPDFAATKDEDEASAQRILDAFDGYVQQLRFRVFCYDYAQSNDYESSLRNCNQALELNPSDFGVLYQRARVYFETDRLEDALIDLKAILETETFNEEALRLAGFVATSLGRNDEGREFYGSYLKLNPGAVAVRRRIAYDIFEAGDPVGAMLLSQEGLEVGENANLSLDVGNYAFNAAVQAMRAAAADAGPDEETSIPAEVEALYRTAIGAYLTVFAVQPDSMSVSSLQNVIRAYMQLEELQEALDVGQQVLALHPEESSVWAVYADAHRRAGNVDEALEAFAEIESIDPDYPQLHEREANLLIQAGRAVEAVPYLQKAVERGADPNRMARTILSDAHTNGVREEKWDYAVELLALAKESFEVGPAQLQELNFWHAYSVYTPAAAIADAQTLASARATLPMFQSARRLFLAARGYTQSDINLYVENTDTYIEIQEAIIKRGGRS